MAVIGKIRQRSGLLIVVIGIALAAFILGDFAKKDNRQTPNIGVVNGENISIQDFNRKFEENVEATRKQRQVERLSQDEMFRVRETTWNQMVQDMVMKEEMDKLGLIVTTEELFDQIQGTNPHPAVISNFQNPETGQYDRSLVMNYLQNLDQMQQAAKDQWLVFERYIKEDRLKTKYENLITKSYHMPKAMAELTFHDKNDKVQISLTGIRYATVADSLVTVSDKDYQEFYTENKKSFEREATRDIEYLVFDIVASQEDNNKAQAMIQQLAEEFRSTTNIAGFVNANSETRYDSTWLTREAVPVNLESIIFDQEPGFVYGPYFDEGSYKLTRLVDATSRPDSLKASHILIAYSGSMRSEQTRTKAQAQTMADSLLNEIKKKNLKITDLAATLSDDQSAQTNAGDLGWFKDGQMVVPFNNFVLDNKVGTIGIAETDFGYHIIEVTGKKEPQKMVRLATITYEVAPSTKTYQDVFAKASKFATDNKTAEQFNKTVEADGLNKRVAPALREMSNRIPGIENPRQVIRWAFDSETSVGDVSTIFDLDDMFVIALLTKKSDKGIPELADIKETIQPQVLNKKKGEYIVEKMKSQGEDLNLIASTFNSQVETTDLTFDSRMLLNFGQESKVIGKIFTLSNGSFAPIAGSTAAFAVKVNNTSVATLPSQLDQLTTEGRSAFEASVRNNAAFRALEKVIKIEDNRMLFY